MCDVVPNGRIVGVLSSLVPRELPYALGCTPVRVFPAAAKATTAEAYLPRNFCSLSKLLLASFLERDAPRLDAVIFADEDDAVRRLHDVWCSCVGVPVWGFLEVPRVDGDLAVACYAELLMRLAHRLETNTGQPLTTGQLRAAIGVYNEQRGLLNDLKRHWLDGALSTMVYRRLRRVALTEHPLAANQQLRQDLDDLGRGSVGAAVDETPAGPMTRVLLMAELAAPTSLVRQLESHAAQVVGEVSDLDELDLSDPVMADADTVEGLAASLAAAYLSKVPSPRARNLPRRLAHLNRLISDRSVQAVICAYYKFCDLHLAEFPTLKVELERAGVPVLLLEMEDDTLSGQHRTRVEAFLEMVQGRG